MKYLILEGWYGVCYSYHFPLLNHFRHHDSISIPFFLLHELVYILTNVKEKMKKGANYTILHQGLMSYLYHFHLAMLPPSIVEVDIPTYHDPHRPHVPMRITGPRIPTPQHSPSRFPIEIEKTPLMTLGGG